LTEDCSKRQQSYNLLATYNLVSAIEFPTRIAKDCASAIDSIYIGKTHIGRYTVCPVINGLSCGITHSTHRMFVVDLERAAAVLDRMKSGAISIG
jgi:hypothetical protein